MPLPPDLTIDEIRATARRDADRILHDHWPSRTTSVDPRAIAHALGARVRTAPLGEHAWGMLVGQADGVDLVVDDHGSELRSRFACAHKIGHLVERGGAISPQEALTDMRSAHHRTRAEETYANEFAVALLLPESPFLAARANGDDDVAIARRFLVPPVAVRWRGMHLRREGKAARPAA
ncbi:hypothetical protein GCM10022237_40740 [Nocardioides ginsengisoli]|uniref:ImmA/IrrE family metallo-endopeptidase n=1 Tax=Nocardioides ginsengisoli TaxID=363868 RepID=A0ABW3W3Z0_9ACTN